MMPILLTTEQTCAMIAATASVSASLTCTVYTGLDSDEKTAPAIICSSDSAVEEVPYTGVYRVRTDIIIKENAADTTGSLGSLSNVIFEKFLTIDTGSFSSGSNMSAYDIQVEGTDNSVEGDVWKQTLTLSIVGVLI